MNKGNSITKVIKKCINCKFYKPNISYDTLGICLVKEIDSYHYVNHSNYAYISRGKYGQCGKEGKLFKLKDVNSNIVFHKII